MEPTPQPTAACAIDAAVHDVRFVCREHVEIELRTSELPPSAPGQFLQLRCSDAWDAPGQIIEWHDGTLPQLTADQWQTDQALLRRPFSIGDRFEADDGSHVVIIARVIGRGTRWLGELQRGDTLNITGPLGTGFTLPPVGTPLVLVGGGVGIPPLLYLARDLRTRGHDDVTVIFGATSGALLPVPLITAPDTSGQPIPCVRLPGNAKYGTIVTTDDGSVGFPGRVTDALRHWVQARNAAAPPAEVLACGPEPMLRAVAALTRQADWPCQLCIERLMGCGMGTCLSCVVRVHDEQAPGGVRWALSCSEGPVFARDRLIDY